MSSILSRLLLLLLITLSSSKLFADQYELEPVHTQILFFCDHLGFSKSQGEFLEFDGSFTFKPENPESSSAEITIQTASIDMDNQKWNDHMKNEDFFDVESFPTMTFKSTRVESISAGKMHLYGELTLLDQTHPVTLKVTHNKSGVHPFSGKYIAGFSATTSIKRSQYGMTYGLPALGDDIEVRLEVEGIKLQ
jgi:polyisoprenoid-binding protein YceI